MIRSNGMKNEKITKQQENKLSQEEKLNQLSPMSPPNLDEIIIPKSLKKTEQCHLISKLKSEHIELISLIKKLQTSLTEIEQSKEIGREQAKVIASFLDYMSDDFIEHNEEEEKILFPILREVFIRIGETNNNFGAAYNPIDILESEHTQVMQLIAVINNNATLMRKMVEKTDRVTVLDSFIQHSKMALNILESHIVREDQIVFTLALNHLTQEEIKAIDL